MPGLDEKLHLPEILNEVAKKWTDDDEYSDGLDIGAGSPEEPDSAASQEKPPCPPILAYIHPKASSDGMAPIIRRVDTASLLLNVSLQLAKLPSIEEAGVKEASPYAHPKKIAYPEGVKQRTTITQADSLVAEQVIVEEKVAIKESVVGANCTIREGAKLTRCVLMDGVEVGKFARLTGCILGRRCRIGEKSNLTDCEVQENLIIEEGSKLMLSRPLQDFRRAM
jgi:translation initiation factor eIF-2B subunit gamma